MSETVANYLPAAFPRSSAGHIAIADGTIVSNWTADFGWDCWDGISKEFASARELGGKRYWYGDGFGNPTAGFQYPMNSVVDRLTMNGVTVDMAATFDKPKGVCFLPWDLPDTGVIEGEQWFYLYPTPAATIPDRPGYYRFRVTLGQMIENPGWKGDGPKTRRCLLLEEVWWDSFAGWVRGGPVTSGATPWKKSSNADQHQAWVDATQLECPSVFHTTNFYAKDTGPLWIGTENGQAVHLVNVELGPLPTPSAPPKDDPVTDDALIAALDRNTAATEANTAALQAHPPSPSPEPSPSPAATPTPEPSPSPAATPTPGGTAVTLPVKQEGVRLLTQGMVGSAPYRFTIYVPADAASQAVYRFAGAEIATDGPRQRHATFTDSIGALLAEVASSNTVTIYAGVGFPGYPSISPGSIYYLTVDTPGLADGVPGNMYFDFQRVQ